MYSDLQYLATGLPEDIQKLKWYGDFKRAQRVIDLRLKKDIPLALRKRLELEKEILLRTPSQYPYSLEAALEILKENIEDFQEEELEQLRDENAIEWIYIMGKVAVKDDFLDNLLKTRYCTAERLKKPELLEARKASHKLLDETIAQMKRQGSLAYAFQIRSEFRVKDTAERCGEQIRVHLPLPIEYAQVRDFKLLSYAPSPAVTAQPEYPQRTICFDAVLEKDQKFYVEYQFENHMSYVELKPEEALESQPGFHTQEQLPHVHFTPYMKNLTREVVGLETNPVKKARKIYDYITTHVMYSFVRSYFTITDIPEYMATGFKGDCGIQALLFITMCRCAGIPARWQAGLFATSLDAGCHDWAQFYIAPYGWIYADCSFGGAAYRAGATERWNFYFGNLDPFRVPANSEFQHEFYPPKKHLRSDPYDNQMGEAEYEDCGLLMHQDYETIHKVIRLNRIESN